MEAGSPPPDQLLSISGCVIPISLEQVLSIAVYRWVELPAIAYARQVTRRVAHHPACDL